MQALHVPRPIGSRVAEKFGSEVKRWRRETIRCQFFSEARLKILWKRIDGRVSKVLAENLSLIGRLFEIYFVRLIGTPNQNSKALRLRSEQVYSSS